MDVYTKAKTALKKALELDDELAEAHLEAALRAFWCEWDWAAAEDSFRRTLALNPGNALAHAHYAWYCLARGRFDEAAREIKLAQSLDPLMPLFYAFSTGIHGAMERPDEAIEEFQRAMELDPNIGLAYFHAGVAYYKKELMDKAISAFQKIQGIGGLFRLGRVLPWDCLSRHWPKRKSRENPPRTIGKENQSL